MTSTQQEIINLISSEISRALSIASHEQYYPDAGSDKSDAIIAMEMVTSNKLQNIRKELEILFTGVLNY